MPLRTGFLAPLLVLPLVLHGACSSSETAPPSDAGAVPVRDGSTEERRLDSNEIPCEPRAVLHAVCQQCHTDPPVHGAPFPLVHRSDILRTRSGTVVRERMIEVVEAKIMPLAPVTITPEDRTTLLGWLKAGAPAVSPRECPTSAADAGSDASSDDAGDGG